MLIIYVIYSIDMLKKTQSQSIFEEKFSIQKYLERCSSDTYYYMIYIILEDSEGR